MELFSIKNWSDELGEIGLFTKSVRYGGGIYGYEVKALNQQVKRNIDRFPEDFMFQLSNSEIDSVRSQIVTSQKKDFFKVANCDFKRNGNKRGLHIKKLPYAFTEHGEGSLIEWDEMHTKERSKKYLNKEVKIMIGIKQ